MLHRVEPDHAPGNRGLNAGENILWLERFQQPQHLDKLSLAAIAPARLKQAAERGKLLGQFPTGQRRRLIERTDLALKQRQIVKRVEDEVFLLIRPGVPGDDVRTAGDHDLVDIAADQNLAVGIGRRHRVIGPPVAHQRQRADTAALLLARVIGCRRQRLERRQVAHQPFANRLSVTA